jgi:hypothetical protein
LAAAQCTRLVWARFEEHKQRKLRITHSMNLKKVETRNHGWKVKTEPKTRFRNKFHAILTRRACCSRLGLGRRTQSQKWVSLLGRGHRPSSRNIYRWARYLVSPSFLRNYLSFNDRGQWIRGHEEWTFRCRRHFGDKGLEIQLFRTVAIA